LFNVGALESSIVLVRPSCGSSPQSTSEEVKF
jgi:hypothetical protein